MSYRVRVTDTAKQDRREIALYILEESGSTETAKRFVTELRGACQKLTDFPNAGALPKDRILVSLGFRYIPHKDYLIFYSVDEAQKTVHILAVFNSKKDYMRVMRAFI